jgi:hypothetical protein
VTFFITVNIEFALNSIFSDVKIATLSFHQLGLAWYLLTLPLFSILLISFELYSLLSSTQLDFS